MKKFQLFVGIDVPKLSLDFYLLKINELKNGNHFKVANSTEGIKDAITQLPKDLIKSKDVLFCFEDTGVYSMILCYYFEKRSIPYACVPAIEIKKSKGIKRGKSDRYDAKDIAHYAKTHVDELQLRKLPLFEIQELKVLLSERDKLVKTIKIFKSTREAFGYIDEKALKNLKKNNAKTIESLENQLDEIDGMINQSIAKNQTIKSQKDLLQSIPGVGPQTAMFLIIYSNCFHNFDNWRQMACFAGVAPFPYQSGTSIHGRTKVSHLAQKKIKSLLNMAALTAIKYDKELSVYYKRKVAQGKNKMSVLNAVRCKILARAFAVINRNSPFVDMRKFVA